MDEFEKAVARLFEWTPTFLDKASVIAEDTRRAMDPSASRPPGQSRKAHALFLWRDAEQAFEEVLGAMRDIRTAIKALPDE